MRSDIVNRKSEILQWIYENTSKAEISRRLCCKVDTLDRYLRQLNLVYDGNRGSKGFNKRGGASYIPFVEYIRGKDVQTNKLRKKLLREKLKKPMCERCCNTTWQGVAIPLEVHHIDGNKENNELSNLQLLCPNCHALTPNYRGKNIKKH